MKVLAGILMFPIVALMVIAMGVIMAVAWVFGVPIKLTRGDETKSYRWFKRVR